MAAPSFDSLWKLMTKYSFETEPGGKDLDLKCGICKKLMVDACHSVCGCQYCYKCIIDFIGDGVRLCDGGKDKCQDEPLVIDATVFRNQVVNIRIARVKVLCPNSGCLCITDINQVENHLRVCMKQPPRCPYVLIGCDNDEASEDTILTHLQSGAFTHSQLLIELIQNLKNEVEELKENSKNDKLEFMTQIEESRMKDMQVREIIVQMEERQRGIILQAEEQKIEIIAEMEKQKREIIAQIEEKESGEIIGQMDEKKRGIILQAEEQKIEIIAEMEKQKGEIIAEIEEKERGIILQAEKQKNEILAEMEKQKGEINTRMEKIQLGIVLQAEEQKIEIIAEIEEKERGEIIAEIEKKERVIILQVEKQKIEILAKMEKQKGEINTRMEKIQLGIVLQAEEQNKKIVLQIEAQKKIITDQKKESISQNKEHQRKLDLAKEESNKNQKKMISLGKESSDMNLKLCKLEGEMNAKKTQLDLLSRSIDDCKNQNKKLEKSDEDREKRMIKWIKWNKLLPNINVDFVWKIEECSKKIKTMRETVKSLYSEPFYLKQSKLCLSMFIDDDEIYMSCNVAKSDNEKDKMIQSAKKYAVLNIVNQDTFGIHKSVKIEYDTSGCCVNLDSFIKYSSIKDDKSIVLNDSIIVSCDFRDSA